MLRSRKGVPAAFVILSSLYFVFVVSSGSSRMIGDDGGDPGSMLLPLVLSIGMFVLSVYLLLKEKPVPDEPLSKDEKMIFALSIIGCLLYVALYRTLGFVLASIMLLFVLTYTYNRGRVSFADFKYGASGLFFSILFMLFLYSAGRFITKFLLHLGRSSETSAWLGAAFTVFSANLIVLAALFLLIRKITSLIIGGKKNQNENLRVTVLCVFVSVAAVELLFLIFRQLFLVNLARGLIYW